ncbi:hypothetical protein [Streptomyces chilikensis]|uniref:Integral membrane protein n=1 Tax=Streptomyces chilikensis TaxID=1194079 RepID=A0ABV3EXW8_9ACTN
MKDRFNSTGLWLSHSDQLAWLLATLLLAAMVARWPRWAVLLLAVTTLPLALVAFAGELQHKRLGGCRWCDITITEEEEQA